MTRSGAHLPRDLSVPAAEPRDALDQVAGGFAFSDEGVAPGHVPLFRQEALDAAKSTGFGQPIAAYPLSWSALSLGLLGMLVVAVLVLSSMQYSRKETVRGVVRAIGGDARVVVSTPGTITAVNVTEGQEVRAGDRLLTISAARVGMDGRPNDEASLRSIDGEIASLRGRLSALDLAAAAERSGRQSRIAALQTELETATAIQRLAEERLKLAQQALDKATPAAAKGFISGEQMRRRHDEIIALDQSIGESRGRQANLTGQLSDLRTAASAQPFVVDQQRGTLLDQIAHAERERQSYLAQQGYVVNASTSGVVSAIQAVRGQAVDPTRPLMTITAGAAATAELYVPSRAIGFLQRGQRVRVRYDAFPFEHFGAAEGRVRSISFAVLKPEEVQAPVQVNEPVYRVVIGLERSTVRAYGKNHAVQPGSALTADIVLEHRSLASTLLEPIRALTGRL